MRLGRRAWGCDLNPEVIKWRPIKSDYSKTPRSIDGEPIKEQDWDKEYPFYKIQEAGLTEEQFEKITVHLFETATVNRLKGAPGIGEKKAKEFLDALSGVEKPDGTIQTGIDSFSIDEE